jgi:hypothetical protein
MAICEPFEAEGDIDLGGRTGRMGWFSDDELFAPGYGLESRAMGGALFLAHSVVRRRQQ